MKKKLKPIIFVKGQYNYHRQNEFQQGLLLKALQVTTNPNELRKMIGVKTVADVYRTLDKLAIRKEYHEALAQHGLDLYTIVEGIKKICMDASSDAIRLRGYQTLLKSIGLEDYKESVEDTKGTWEDVLLEHLEKKKIEAPKIDKVIDYEVVAPEVPEEDKKRIAKEREAAKGLYD